MKFNFLALKKEMNKTKNLKIKITAIFFYQFVLDILFYSSCDLQI